MDLIEETRKLESAFNKAHICKVDTCTLWATLSSTLLYKGENLAYPVLGTLTFENKVTNEKGHYDGRNNSFHVATLYYSNNVWYLLDFSTNYLISENFNIVSLYDCPIQVEVPELTNIAGQDYTKIDSVLKNIAEISVSNENYTYSFIPERIHIKLNEQNDKELYILESFL